MAGVPPLAYGAKPTEEQFTPPLNLLSECEHPAQLLAGIRSVLDTLEVDPYLWRFRLPPPADGSVELFLESRGETATWRSPAAPENSQEKIASIDILVDLLLWPAESGCPIFPCQELDNPANVTDCRIEPVYYFLRCSPLVYEIVRRSQEDAEDVQLMSRWHSYRRCRPTSGAQSMWFSPSIEQQGACRIQLYNYSRRDDAKIDFKLVCRAALNVSDDQYAEMSSVQPFRGYLWRIGFATIGTTTCSHMR